MLAWQLRKLKTVVKCIITTETLASERAMKLVILVKTLLLETLNIYMQNQILSINCVTDSKSLHELVYST